MVAVETNVLLAGLRGKCRALRRLPVRLLAVDTGMEAVRCLRTEEIDIVISNWDLADMPDGEFLARLIAARPSIPVIAFVRPWDHDREIAARILGAAAVFSDDIDDEHLHRTACQLLGMRDVSATDTADSFSVASGSPQ
jgi:DNA-binding NarL/FixJ family response regulator